MKEKNSRIRYGGLLLSLLLAMIMTVMFMPAAAFADDEPFGVSLSAYYPAGQEGDEVLCSGMAVPDSDYMPGGALILKPDVDDWSNDEDARFVYEWSIDDRLLEETEPNKDHKIGHSPEDLGEGFLYVIENYHSYDFVDVDSFNANKDNESIRVSFQKMEDVLQYTKPDGGETEEAAAERLEKLKDAAREGFSVLFNVKVTKIVNDEEVGSVEKSIDIVICDEYPEIHPVDEGILENLECGADNSIMIDPEFYFYRDSSFFNAEEEASKPENHGKQDDAEFKWIEADRWRADEILNDAENAALEKLFNVNNLTAAQKTAINEVYREQTEPEVIRNLEEYFDENTRTDIAQAYKNSHDGAEINWSYPDVDIDFIKEYLNVDHLGYDIDWNDLDQYHVFLVHYYNSSGMLRDATFDEIDNFAKVIAGSDLNADYDGKSESGVVDIASVDGGYRITRNNYDATDLTVLSKASMWVYGVEKQTYSIPSIRYEIETERDMLAGGEGTIDGSFRVRHENTKGDSYDDYFDVVKVDVDGDEAEKYLQEYHHDGNDDSDWWYYRIRDIDDEQYREGTLTFTVYYLDPQDKDPKELDDEAGTEYTDSYEFNLNIVSDIYETWIEYDEDRWSSGFPGETYTLQGCVKHRYFDKEDNNQYKEEINDEVKDCDFEWSLDSGDRFANLANLAVDNNDHSVARLTFADATTLDGLFDNWRTDGIDLDQRVSVRLIKGGKEVASNEENFLLTDWFARVWPKKLEDLEVGESIRTDFDIRLYKYNGQPYDIDTFDKPEVTGWEIDYDDDCFEITYIKDGDLPEKAKVDRGERLSADDVKAGDGGAFTITRTKDWDTEINVWTYFKNPLREGEKEDRGERYRFDYKDYRIDMYCEREDQELFTDGTLSYDIDCGVMSRDDWQDKFELELEVGIGRASFNGEGSIDTVDWEKKFSDSAYEVSADGRSITLKGDKLKDYAFQNAVILATLKLKQDPVYGQDAEDIILNAGTAEFFIRDPEIDYNGWAEDEEILPNNDGELGRWNEVRIRNSEFPRGESFDYEVTGVEVTDGWEYLDVELDQKGDKYYLKKETDENYDVSLDESGRGPDAWWYYRIKDPDGVEAARKEAGDDHPAVTFKVSYKDYDYKDGDAEKSYSFTRNIVNERFFADFYSDDGCDNGGPGSKFDLTAAGWKEFINDEGYNDGTDEGFRFSFEITEGKDFAEISQNASDSSKATLSFIDEQDQSVDYDEVIAVKVYAYAADDGEGSDPVAECEKRFWLTTNHIEMFESYDGGKTWVTNKDPELMPGDSATAKYELRHYIFNNDRYPDGADIVHDSKYGDYYVLAPQYSWDFDTSVVEIRAMDGTDGGKLLESGEAVKDGTDTFTFTRKTGDYTNLSLDADFGHDEERFDYWMHLDYVEKHLHDYELEFINSEDGWRIFTEGDAALTADDEIRLTWNGKTLGRDNYDLEIWHGYYDNDDQQKWEKVTDGKLKYLGNDNSYYRIKAVAAEGAPFEGETDERYIDVYSSTSLDPFGPEVYFEGLEKHNGPHPQRDYYWIKKGSSAEPVVKLRGAALKKGTDYTVSYVDENTDEVFTSFPSVPGTYTCLIKPAAGSKYTGENGLVCVVVLNDDGDVCDLGYSEFSYNQETDEVSHTPIYSAGFDQKYRKQEEIESTPYEDWFYVVHTGTELAPVVTRGDKTLGADCYTAKYRKCEFSKDDNEWQQVESAEWQQSFPAEEGVYICEISGKSPYYGTYQGMIDLIRIENHNYGSQVAEVPASCTSDGVKAHYECSVCHKKFVKDGSNYVEKTDEDLKIAGGHSLEAHAKVPATCKEAGTEAYWECTVCHAKFSDSEGKTPIEAPTAIAKLTTHTWNNGQVTKAATCKEAGVKTFTCSVCSATKTEEIAKLTNHTWNNGQVTKAATCKEAGVKTFTCSVCSATKTETIPVDPDAHDAVNDPAVSASCTQDGKTAGSHCSLCGAVLTPQTVIPANGHSWGEWIIDPPSTCQAAGSRYRICSVCGTKDTEGLEIAEHEWDAEYTVDVEPLCETDGSKSIHCKNCSATKDSQTIPALGHDYQIVEGSAVAPTIESAGKEADHKCSRCGGVIQGAEIAQLIDISTATVTVASTTYTGKARKPKVTVTYDGKALTEGTDFTVSYKNNTKAGSSAVATVTGIGLYGGSVSKKFTISKAANKLTVKAAKSTQTVKYNKTAAISAIKAFKVNKNTSKGKVTYKKTKGNSKITVSKSGKITVKKGLAKGTYPVKVKATSAATTNYKAKSVTVSFKIKVQ